MGARRGRLTGTHEKRASAANQPGLTTKELQRRFGPPVRGRTCDDVEVGRLVVTIFFPCGCTATDARAENDWDVNAGPSCTAEAHERRTTTPAAFS